MKLTKEAILSIVIAILFIGSIFGFAIGSRPDDINTNNNINNNQTDSNLSEEVYYTTIDSNVLSIYPQIIFTAQTTNFELSNIQDTFRNIQGIKDPKLNFSQDQNKNIILTGRFIIEETEKTNIINKIQDLNFLSEVNIYQYGLVSLPKETIKLTKENNTTTKEYEFTTQKIEGILGINTQKDDQISAQLQVVFKGEVPTRFLVFEYQNLSETPQMIEDKINLSVKKWIEEYLFISKNEMTKNITKEQIENILSDFNSNIEIYTDGTLKLDGNKIMIEDANTYLKSQMDINNSGILNYDINQNMISISFSEQINSTKYNKLILDLNSFVKQDNYIISQPKQIINILINQLNQQDLNTQLINNKLKKLNISIDNIYKKAEFDLSEITIKNKKYTYSDSVKSTWVNYPEDINKEKIELTIQAFTQRDKLMFVNLNRK
jgi:hypothetical protein